MRRVGLLPVFIVTLVLIDRSHPEAGRAVPVTARGPAPVVDACTAATGTTIDRRSLDNLPVSRSFDSLANIAPAVGRFNGDRNPDVVAADMADGMNRLTTYPGCGDLTFAQPSSVLVDGVPTAMAVGDIDMDQIDEVVVATDGTAGQRLSVFTGSQGGVLALRNSFTDRGRTNQLAVADLDGDGTSEIVSLGGGTGAGPRVNVFDGKTGSSKGSFDAMGASSFALGTSNYPGPNGMVDADQDIFAATTSGVRIFENNLAAGGTGVSSFMDAGFLGFAGGGSGPGFSGGMFVATGDINGDGRADAVTGGPNGAVNTFLADPNGLGYGSPSTFSLGQNPIVGLQRANYNADGFSDFAATCTGIGGGMSMLHMLTGGQAGLGRGQDFPLSMGMAGLMAVGRLGDGMPTDDVAVMNRMGGGPDVFGQAFPGDPFGRHPFTIGPGSDAFEFTDLEIAIDLGGLIDSSQAMFIEVTVTVVMPPAPLLGQLDLAHPAMRPLARSLTWAGSLLRPPSTRRMDAAEPWVQQRTAPIGKPVLRGSITSLGASTGEAFDLSVTNESARPARMLPDVLVVEPRQPRGRAAPAAARGRTALVKANGYCLDFKKEAPLEGMQYKIADRALQERMRPMKLVIDSANRLARSGQLHPDSDPVDYGHAIKQWALWTKRENWDLKKFSDAFVERTKKNFAALKQNWTKDIETEVRSFIPGRWRDIASILAAAK